MERIQRKCPGDCSTCPLLAEGLVDMMPCAIDQLMQRSQTQAKQIEEIRNAIAATPAALASTPTETPTTL